MERKGIVAKEADTGREVHARGCNPMASTMRPGSPGECLRVFMHEQEIMPERW